MSLPRLPDWIAPSSRSSIAPRASINRASRPRESRIRLAAREAVPVLYGRVIVPPKVFAAGRDGNHLVLGCLWGAGPLSTAPALAMRNGDPLPGSVQVAHVLGSADQTPHAWLQAAIPGYMDTLIAQGPGGSVPLAYTVLRMPADVRPDIQGELIGPALYDPRIDDVLWPALNPALWLLDWLSNPLYGCGQAVDWAGSIPAIDACDELIDNEPRRWGGLLIDRAAPHASHVDALRTYAGCLIVPSESGLRLVPRRPAAVSRHVPAEQWIGSLSIERLSRDQRPTVVTVQYTDTRAIPWTTGTARAYAPGVLAGTAPWRESSITLPGYQSHEVAYREAVERLNHATLAPYRIEGLATDEALRELPGDVITITHPDGLTAQPARVLSVQPEGPGRWRIAVEPYSAALYSDDVQGESNPIHTDLPDPSAPPPPVDALVVDEEVYQQQTGLYATRLRITWAASEWPYTQSYRVEVWQGEELVWRIETRQPEAVTGTLQELVAYTVRVMAVGPLTVGQSAEQTITAQGKYLPPSDVPELTGYEVGGEVHLAWQPATDVDIWRYEIAYGAVGGNLQSAALLDRVDGLRLVTRDVPAGPWRFYIRAIDSVGQYSANPAVCDLTVTLDNAAYLVDEQSAAHASDAGMTPYTLRLQTEPKYITDHGAMIGASTFLDYADQPLVMMQPIGQTEWLSTVADWGTVITGTVTGSLTYQVLRGSAAARVEASADGVLWSHSPGMALLGSYRYARVRVFGQTPDALIHVEGDANLRIDAQTRERRGDVLTDTLAPAHVVIDEPFYAAVFVGLTVQSASAAYAVYDDVQVGAQVTFDIYAFDYQGNRLAVPVGWKFEGI